MDQHPLLRKKAPVIPKSLSQLTDSKLLNSLNQQTTNPVKRSLRELTEHGTQTRVNLPQQTQPKQQIIMSPVNSAKKQSIPLRQKIMQNKNVVSIPKMPKTLKQTLQQIPVMKPVQQTVQQFKNHLGQVIPDGIVTPDKIPTDMWTNPEMHKKYYGYYGEVLDIFEMLQKRIKFAIIKGNINEYYNTYKLYLAKSISNMYVVYISTEDGQKFAIVFSDIDAQEIYLYIFLIFKKKLSSYVEMFSIGRNEDVIKTYYTANKSLNTQQALELFENDKKAYGDEKMKTWTADAKITEEFIVSTIPYMNAFSLVIESPNKVKILTSILASTMISKFK